MGEEMLFKIFQDEEIEDLQKIIIHIGVDGLMTEFENWLFQKDLINRDFLQTMREDRKLKHNNAPLNN